MCLFFALFIDWVAHQPILYQFNTNKTSFSSTQTKICGTYCHVECVAGLLALFPTLQQSFFSISPSGFDALFPTWLRFFILATTQFKRQSSWNLHFFCTSIIRRSQLTKSGRLLHSGTNYYEGTKLSCSHSFTNFTRKKNWCHNAENVWLGLVFLKMGG